jgi:hypothetical protein
MFPRVCKRGISPKPRTLRCAVEAEVAVSAFVRGRTRKTRGAASPHVSNISLARRGLDKGGTRHAEFRTHLQNPPTGPEYFSRGFRK